MIIRKTFVICKTIYENVWGDLIFSGSDIHVNIQKTCSNQLNRSLGLLF